MRFARARNAGPTQTLVPFATLRKTPKRCSRFKLGGAFSELKLKAGDRLEPCSDLPDVGAFFHVSSFPPEGVPLLLWRPENAVSAQVPVVEPRHRFDSLHCSGLGFTPYKPFGCHAGVLPPRCMGVLAQRCLGSGCVEQNGELQKNMFWLWAWYAPRRLSHATENLTQVAGVTPGLFGRVEDPKLKTKVAETWGMLLFLENCLRL